MAIFLEPPEFLIDLRLGQSGPETLLVRTQRGAAQRALAPAIVSRRAGQRFVGYRALGRNGWSALAASVG